MAKTLAALRNCVQFVACYNLPLSSKFAFAQPQVFRHLYSKASLGLDGYVQQREKTRTHFANISDKFKDKMKAYTEDGTKNMIFTEDLKNMIHIAETDEDFDIAIKMMKKFNSQNKELRFGNFMFGPVIMRMFHLYEKPHLAYEVCSEWLQLFAYVKSLQCFRNPELDGLFDQFTAYHILLDLLYRHEMYNEILEAVEIIKAKQVEGIQYPKNVVVLAMAACYKINTAESFQFAIKLWKNLQDVGQFPMRRSATFYAALALKQNNPAACIEILSAIKNQNYTTVRNLKVAALVSMGRVEDAIPILKSILSEDIAVNNVHTFNREVLDGVRKAVEKLNNPDLKLEFDRIEQMFEKQGQILNATLDEQLCVEIDKKPFAQNQQERQTFSSYNKYSRRPQRRTNREDYQTMRPGLEEFQ